MTVCDRGRGGGQDHVTSRFQFFHNSQFNVLFDILSYIVQIEVANITFRVGIIIIYFENVPFSTLS